MNFELKKTHFVIAIIVSVMLSNVHHVGNLYALITFSDGVFDAFRLDKFSEHFMAIFVSLSIDFSVLFLVINSENDRDLLIAKVFCVAMVVWNLLYWNILQDVYDFANVQQNPQALSKFISKIMFSSFFSFIIYEFSEKYAHLRQTSKVVAGIQHQLSKLEQDASTLLAKEQEMLASVEQVRLQHEQMLSNVTYYEELKRAKSSSDLQVITLQKRIEQMEAQKEKEKVMRTLFLPEQPPRVLESSKALSGSLTKLDEIDKGYHETTRSKKIKQLDEVING